MMDIFGHNAMTLKRAASISRVPVSTIRRWASKGFIRARKEGREWFVDLESVLAMPQTDAGRIRVEVQMLVARLRDDENVTWRDQVPYVVRTEMVNALEDILNA